MMHPLRRAVEAFNDGRSITETLTAANVRLGSPELIEAVYEAQAGTYTSELVGDYLVAYTDELCGIVAEHVAPTCDILDVGTGEGNRFIAVLRRLGHTGRALGVDISWSRLSWAQANAMQAGRLIDLAVADLATLPLPDASVDWVLSAHALEPNAGREAEILAELARVARIGVLLVEPDWGMAGPVQRERMTRLGFIGSLPNAARSVGLELHRVRPIRHNDKADNAASVFVMHVRTTERNAPTWIDPVGGERLHPFGTGLRTAEGLFHPVLSGIPFLRPSDGLMTAHPAPGAA